MVLRTDEAGHLFWGPDKRSLNAMARFFDHWAVIWFASCPVCRCRLPGGCLSPTEFAEHLINFERRVPDFMVDWLRRLARMMEEAEKRGRKPRK
ncbi:hypothetical protein [Stetteria hydrogenophila]